MRTEYSTVGELFQRNPIYRIPKYQRAYAWEELEIEAFLKDLTLCIKKRIAGQPKEHFFGGIVSIREDFPGAVNQYMYKIVDGQQRMATFVLLAYVILELYKELQTGLQQLSHELINQQTGQKQNEWTKRILEVIQIEVEDLTNRFIQFRHVVHNESQQTFVLELSKKDKDWFQQLISGYELKNQHASRDSHRRILKAYQLIRDKVRSLIGALNFTEQQIDNILQSITRIKNLIEQDFKILTLVSSDSKQAYTLFQVLNNRGKNLAEGDLLRAVTLEKLDNPTHLAIQSQVEGFWDKILIDSTETTVMVFRCIYASHKGEFPGSNTLFEDIEASFFSDVSSEDINDIIAQKILDSVKQLHQEFRSGTTLLDGDWIYDITLPNAAWNQSRLYHLMKTLRHKDCLPLLIAASCLNPDKFAKIVSILERFSFRYVTIGNQYFGNAIKVYLEEAKKIRIQDGYNPDDLRNALKPLAEKVNDASFESGLKALRYGQSSDKIIKYFLETLEHYYKWYEDGGHGDPTCREKNRIFSQSDSSIEHLYPKNAIPINQKAEFESDLKHGLGNLCFMDRVDNERQGNNPFSEKRYGYQKSSILMLKEIGGEEDWTLENYQKWEKKLLDMACKVFRI